MSLTDDQRRTLGALADTYVAAVPAPDGVDPTGFFARTGSQAGVVEALELGMSTLDEATRAGLLALLDGFGAFGLADTPVAGREAIVDASPVRRPRRPPGYGGCA